MPDRVRYEGLGRCRAAASCGKAEPDGWHCMFWHNCERFDDDDDPREQKCASICIGVDLKAIQAKLLKDGMIQ